MVLGDLPGVIEIGEPLQRFEGAFEIVGLIETVQLLESVPGHSQPRVVIKQPVQVSLFCWGEMIGPLEQTEPGSEQVRFEGGFHTWGLAALQLPPYQGQSLGEPSSGVEPIENVTSSGKIPLNGCPVGTGTVPVGTRPSSETDPRS